ncbi:MAG: HAMP domain-containing histidine kinase [Oceanospirillaceae bacterium]|nr:HAMP domain-containing histidine kinase [Oceanospirillaceae bacterium]
MLTLAFFGVSEFYRLTLMRQIILERIIPKLAKQYAQAYIAAPDRPLPELFNIQSSDNIHDLPLDLQLKINNSWSDSNVVYSQPSNRFPFLPYFYIKKPLDDGKSLYLHGAWQVEKNILPKNFPRPLFISFAIVAMTILLFSLMLILVFNKFSRPIKILLEWTGKLDINDHNITVLPTKDFRYRELNDLANVISQSLHTAQKSLAREQLFLRHASHELRTPITVISSNLEMLQQNNSGADPFNDQLMQRMSRSIESINQLIETLLWVDRDTSLHCTIKNIDLAALIHEQIDANRHLMDYRQVSLELQLEPSLHCLPVTALRIVLANLIRNAMQHTYRGKISICCAQGWVRIININDSDNRPDQNFHTDSFGLGLSLAEKISLHSGWQLEQQVLTAGRDIRLIITSTKT